MACKIIMGEYKPQPDDVVIQHFSDDVILKKKLDPDQRIILFAEYLQLSKSDIENIMKYSTANVTLVCASTNALHRARRSPKAKIEYTTNFMQPMNPFDVAKLIVKEKDRKWVYGYLKTNKIDMFMVVKVLTSGHLELNANNQRAIAWLDSNLNTKPEILWSYAAFNMQPERYLKYLAWNYPRKGE